MADAATLQIEAPAEPVPPGDILYEVVDGKVVELPPMGADEVWIASTLTQILGPYVRAHALGRVVAEMLFHLQPERPRRRPDVAFVSYDRWPRGRRVPRREAWNVVPDLAVEVVSESNSAAEVIGKIREYFEAGVARVWVVYPTERIVYDYESLAIVCGLGPGDVLDGGAILPGYRLPVADLFDDEAE